MAANKKPRKPYRPRWNTGGVKLRTEPWRVEAVFSPLETILAMIERDGTVTSTISGVPIFQDTNDGCWYETTPSVEGIICAYEIHANRSGRAMPLEPLQRLVQKLRYAMPLQQSDVDAARATLAVLRRETMDMRVEYARDLVRTTQVRIEMDAREVA